MGAALAQAYASLGYIKLSAPFVGFLYTPSLTGPLLVSSIHPKPSAAIVAPRSSSVQAQLQWLFFLPLCFGLCLLPPGTKPLT